MALPKVAVIAAGSMGAAVGRRLTTAGLTVFTNLDGRSPATRSRAQEAGLKDVSLSHIAQHADWVLSILPPKDAYNFAKAFGDTHASSATNRPLNFADCNAVNPETVKRVSSLFAGTSIKFIDAGIIGGPPQDDYDPTFYASSAPADADVLNEFVRLSKYGLKIKALKGEGADIGDASALKMSYAGIAKGVIGLYSTMILAAHASSPATAQALLEELTISQPYLAQHLIRGVPSMLPKAYRWVAEMEEISNFVGNGLAATRSGAQIGDATKGEPVHEGHIHYGFARLYENVARSLEEGKGGDVTEVKVLKDFVEQAKKVLPRKE
ncbi:6-phosphogluconate dehydrogenase C-terminal domain-like protein [Irpex rosettiformis]|uniref:6-phosphogluconate dehydrogenase C-terminal domain-like protein n=1 Tax=Irpex rosettiformis TaxID=378272 RepID=A0ACB8UES8_9APHY|nr:6-phosphogluconate dehydrogenase C-terminal domain-like protein [Irpex rosettiformis]